MAKARSKRKWKDVSITAPIADNGGKAEFNYREGKTHEARDEPAVIEHTPPFLPPSCDMIPPHLHLENIQDSFGVLPSKRPTTHRAQTSNSKYRMDA